MICCTSFIFDIAAFQLKPLFLVGSVITAVGYIFTVCTVHFARYDRRMFGMKDERGKKTFSVLAMFSGIIAGVGLILQAILDTYRFHPAHAILLLVCLVGITGSMIFTSVVYFDQVRKPSPFRRLRML